MNAPAPFSRDWETVRTWLAGTYSNRDQAMDQPVWFSPVTLWYVSLSDLFAEGWGFFTEQVNQHTPNDFYRSRVLQLLDHPLRLENYKLRDQQAWMGASQDAARLAQLKLTDLDLLPGCTLYLTPEAEGYRGRMAPGLNCRLTPASTQAIEIDFFLTAAAFITTDRGIDMQTGRQT
jgi:hypothetical protein